MLPYWGHYARLGDEGSALAEAGVDGIQWDIMDGSFVPEISFGAPVVAAPPIKAVVDAIRGTSACRDTSSSPSLRSVAFIMVGEGDTFVEDLHGYIGLAGVKRGWNVCMEDYPLRCVLPFDGLVMRADYEVMMTAVVDQELPSVFWAVRLLRIMRCGFWPYPQTAAPCRLWEGGPVRVG